MSPVEQAMAHAPRHASLACGVLAWPLHFCGRQPSLLTVQFVRAQLVDGLCTVGFGSVIVRLWALHCARDDERGSVRCLPSDVGASLIEDGMVSPWALFSQCAAHPRREALG